jgi:hypothetical protein
MYEPSRVRVVRRLSDGGSGSTSGSSRRTLTERPCSTLPPQYGPHAKY